MGDRHGGRFARRGRTLSPPRPQVDAHRAAGFRWRATVFRCRGVVGRICPAQEHAPRRKPPDTARRRKDLSRAGTLSSAKASRHSARAKGFAPRENAPHGEGLPTRRTSERICPAQERSPRQRPPDTAHERKNLPRGVRPRPTCRRTAGRPLPVPRQKNTPSAGSHPQRATTAEFIHRKKIRLLHETQLFYGESHVGSRQIFPSVGRCVARERNPVPPVAPHRGSEPRGLRRTGEMVRRFDAMCPRGGRCDPGIRCFDERFHRRRCANPDACRGRRCSRGQVDLGQRAFRYFRPAFRTPLCDNEKNCGGRRCSRGQDDLGRRAFRCARPGIRNRGRSGE